MYTLKLEREVLLSSKDQIKEFVMPFKDKYTTSFWTKKECASKTEN